MRPARLPAASSLTLPRFYPARLTPVACHRLPRRLGCTDRRPGRPTLFILILSRVAPARRVVWMCISWGLGTGNLPSLFFNEGLLSVVTQKGPCDARHPDGRALRRSLPTTPPGWVAP